jgi:putative flippase GtrA
MFLRFVANGVFATLVHFGVLSGLIESGVVRSAGLANAFAAVCGIAASYLGNRLLVFKATSSHAQSLPRFIGVYACVAAIHAIGLTVWTDIYGRAYWIGFIGLTAMSLLVTFFANRFFVFKNASGAIPSTATLTERPVIAEITKLLWVSLIIGAGFLLCIVGNIIHFRLFRVSVVLYDAILDITIGTAIAAALYLIFLSSRLKLNPTEFILTIAAIWLAGLTYAVYFPAIIDRSLSMYILEKIDQRGGGIRQDAFEEVFIKEYVPEHRLVDIRITEQLNSGTIAIVDGCVVLTERGRRVVAFTTFYRQNLLPKSRDIMGRFVDDLTNPFRNSRQDVTYGCRPGQPPQPGG